MDWIGQWLLVALAVAAGWLVAYLQFRSVRPGREKGTQNRYPETLQYLFEAYDAPTLDSFAQDLEVNDQTVQLHLSIANYFRRKGEIEKATSIHQNLLAHPDARLQHAQQLTFELAQDYMVAGLYDRAEALFVELTADRNWKRRSVESLLEIYEHEKDWEIAKQWATSLEIKKDAELQRKVAHYCCEMAERSLRRKDYAEARQLAKEALGHDKRCVRASLQLARIGLLTEQYAEGLVELKRIEQQDPIFLSEAVGLIQELCAHMEDPEKLLRILQRIWEHQPSSTVMMALAMQMTNPESSDEAIEFLLKQLNEHPTLSGVKTLLELLTPYAEPEHRRWIQIIKGVLEVLRDRNQDYCCLNCGFSGRQLHWQCPSCKTWANIKPLPWA